MDITISGRRIIVTDALRDYVNEKVDNSTKVFAIPMTADVVLRFEKNPANPNPNICEITLRAKGTVVRVSEDDPDMYAAIDLACDKVSRQLRKYKTKVVERRQHAPEEPARVVKPLDPSLMDEIFKDEDDLLVREKFIDFDTMTQEHALVQTDLLGHDFFVFTNAETGKVNVVYRRRNGGYGVLRPKE